MTQGLDGLECQDSVGHPPTQPPQVFLLSSRDKFGHLESWFTSLRSNWEAVQHTLAPSHDLIVVLLQRNRPLLRDIVRIEEAVGWKVAPTGRNKASRHQRYPLTLWKQKDCFPP